MPDRMSASRNSPPTQMEDTVATTPDNVRDIATLRLTDAGGQAPSS